MDTDPLVIPFTSNTDRARAGGAELRIALLGDIHANLPALEAVLAHASAQAAQDFWNLGDFVGYGAYPDQVVKRIRQLRAVSIVGNYDLKVLRFPQKKEKWALTKHPQKYQAFKWAYRHLSRKSREYLKSLPKEISLDKGGFRILLTHGSPTSNKEPLHSSTPITRLRELIAVAESDLVLCGHSHDPFKREVDGVWFVNPGSVGRPDDGDPRASYALLGFKDGSLQVDHFRVPYDIDRAVLAQRAAGLPESFSQMLIEGRSLDALAWDS